VSGEQLPSPWSPLRSTLFRSLWLATIVANIGTWMQDVGAGWLMTSLTTSPSLVALVEAADSFPVMLLALPAGAIADIVDRRRLLITVQVYFLVVTTILAVLTFLDLTTPWVLLGFTFAIGVGTAITMPAWAAIVPELVPKEQLASAIALNSIAINVSRAIGPAIAGILVATVGVWLVFALNALSCFAILGVLLWWKREHRKSTLPAERFVGAIRVGLRFVVHTKSLQAVLIRGMGFFLFASATWSLFPVIVRRELQRGPEIYGLLLTCIGIGAVTGMAWITILSALQVTAQLTLPEWVRARGLATFVMVFMAGMALGSILWGQVATHWGTPMALTVAASGMLVAIGLTWRYKLGEKMPDFTPSMHWAAPVLAEIPQPDAGPVMVTIEYRVRPGTRREFVAAMQHVREMRRRNGAYFWELFHNSAEPTLYREIFMDESWTEHLRQHERVSVADREIQGRAKQYLIEGFETKSVHWLADRD
jgi:MFS family permease